LKWASENYNRNSGYKTSLAVFGGLGIAAGGAFAAGLVKIAEHGTKLLDQQDKLQRSGIAYADVLKLQADYYDKIAKAIPTSTAAEYLRTVNELRAVTGSTSGAQALAVKALMVDALLSNTTGKESHGEYYKLLRSAEMKGISTDPEKLQQFTDQAFSYITAFGGKLNAQDYQTFARRGGAAFMNADIGKSMGPLSVLMADLGGSAAGTAAMTLHQFITGAGVLSKQQFEVMKQAGLLNEGGYTDLGGRINIKPGGILGSTQYSGNEPGWIRDVLMPHLREIAGDDPAKLEALIAKIGRNRNTQKLIEMFGMPGFQEQTSKDLGLAGKVSSIPQAYGDFISRNPEGVKKAFGDQFESMMQAIGAPLMQAAIPVMRGVTDMFTNIGSFANAHPDAIRQIGMGIAGLSLSLMGAGGLALLAALGPAGWMVLGVGALASAMVAFPNKWMAVVEAIDGFMNKISDSLKKMLTGLLDWFKSFIPAWALKTSYEGGGMGGSLLHNTAWSGGGGVGSGWSSSATGLQPEFKSRLAALIAEGNASGHPLGITEGFRTHAQQVSAFLHKPGLAARPGHSMHEIGLAADLHGDLARIMQRFDGYGALGAALV
jgi:hypothetical protein